MKDTRPKRIHFVTPYGQTLCNHRDGARTEIPRERMTRKEDEVTCGNCKNTINRRKRDGQ